MIPDVVSAAGEDNSSVTNDLIRSQLNQLQLEEVEEFWQHLQTEYGRFFEKKDQMGLFDILLSDKGLGWKEIIAALGRYFFHEVIYNVKILGTIIVLAVFCMILQTLQTAFEQNQVSKVAYAIVFIIMIILAMDSFQIAIQSAKEAIERMVQFMLALIPLMLTLLGLMGNMVSVTLFHPLIIMMIHVVGTLIYLVIFPLFFLSTILGIVSSISEKYRVTQLANLLKKTGMTLLGIVLTFFLGVISVQGATTAVTDGVTIRTAKYITGNFVPVVGRSISEAADTVVSASLLVKNTIGLAGVIILLLISAFPAIKILTLAFIYQFSAAIMQPLGNSPIIESLSMIGKTFIYVFAALAAVGLMFFLAVAIVIASGNISMMMR
jgi:stage III sporulation protein AE